MSSHNSQLSYNEQVLPPLSLNLHEMSNEEIALIISSAKGNQGTIWSFPILNYIREKSSSLNIQIL